MRSQTQLNPQPRVTASPREPGPDPRPRKRRSTEPLKKEADQATKAEAEAVQTPVAIKPKPRKGKGKGCGSSKPRYALTKALMRLALQEGLYQLAEERAEEGKAIAESSRVPKKEQEYHQAFLEAARPKQEEPNEGICFVSVIVLPDGQEKLTYPGEDNPQAPAKPAKTLDQIINEGKLRRIIETAMAGKVTINIGDLVAAALKDPKVKKLMEETPPPAQKSQRLGFKTAGGSQRKAVNRPTLASSHTRRGKKSSLH